MKYLLVVATFAISFTFTSAFAGLVGQSDLNDGKGTVVCYYEDFNTGAQYSKTALYVCPSQ